MLRSIILSVILIPILCCSVVVNTGSEQCDDVTGEEQSSCINEDLIAEAADSLNPVTSESHNQSDLIDCYEDMYPNGCYVRHSMKSNTDSCEAYCSEDDSWINSSIAKYLDDETDLNPMDNPDISLSSVIGSDERTLVKDPQSYPYVCTAYIQMGYKNVLNQNTNTYEDRNFRGTAFLVGPNVALTAGHCMYSDVTSDGEYQDNTDNPTYPDSIDLYFGLSKYSDMSTSYDYYATASVDDVFMDSHYISSQNTNYDWAILKLDRTIGYEIGWYDIVTDVSLKGCSIKSYGYPKDLGWSMYETSGTVSKVSSNKVINDLDTSGGQSGSPYIVTIDGKDYVCGIHTNGVTTYNYGTILYSDLYDKILSVIGENYNYLTLSLNGKSSGTWTVRIKNTTSDSLTCEYNSKMCNFNDAKYWTNLSDISTITISSGSTASVKISQNWFATSIACSYTVDGFRIISYAKNLSKSGSLSCYYSVIIA